MASMQVFPILSSRKSLFFLTVAHEFRECIKFDDLMRMISWYIEEIAKGTFGPDLMSARRLGKLNRLFDWTPILGKSTVSMFFCPLGGHNKSCSIIYEVEILWKPLQQTCQRPGLHRAWVGTWCLGRAPMCPSRTWEVSLTISGNSRLTIPSTCCCVVPLWTKAHLRSLNIFVFAALLSAHPLSSVEIGEIWPSGGSGRLCSQITDPAFSSSEVAHCQTRALLSVSSWQHAPKCCQVLSELEQGGESPI